MKSTIKKYALIAVAVIVAVTLVVNALFNTIFSVAFNVILYVGLPAAFIYFMYVMFYPKKKTRRY